MIEELKERIVRVEGKKEITVESVEDGWKDSGVPLEGFGAALEGFGAALKSLGCDMSGRKRKTGDTASIANKRARVTLQSSCLPEQEREMEHIDSAREKCAGEGLLMENTAGSPEPGREACGDEYSSTERESEHPDPEREGHNGDDFSTDNAPQARRLGQKNNVEQSIVTKTWDEGRESLLVRIV